MTAAEADVLQLGEDSSAVGSLAHDYRRAKRETWVDDLGFGHDRYLPTVEEAQRQITKVSSDQG